MTKVSLKCPRKETKLESENQVNCNHIMCLWWHHVADLCYCSRVTPLVTGCWYLQSILNKVCDRKDRLKEICPSSFKSMTKTTATNSSNSNKNNKNNTATKTLNKSFNWSHLDRTRSIIISRKRLTDK